MDKYVANIELSNACRQFYQSRLKATESVKAKLGLDKECDSSQANAQNEEKVSRRSSLDVAMYKLRTEMASLMDQDLSLMKQLLTLNESIEDLKWRRRYATTNVGGSFPLSSLSDMDEYSDTDMFDSITDIKVSGISNLSLYNTLDRRSVVASDFFNGNVNIQSEPTTSTMKRSDNANSQSKDLLSSKWRSEESIQLTREFPNSQLTTSKERLQMYPTDQSSFDSGIHSDEERVVVLV